MVGAVRMRLRSLQSFVHHADEPSFAGNLESARFVHDSESVETGEQGFAILNSSLNGAQFVVGFCRLKLAVGDWLQSRSLQLGHEWQWPES